MRRFAVLGALALGACGGGKPPAPPPGPQPTVAAAAPEAPARQIGTTSTLTGQVSGLSGQITDFAVSVTPTQTIVSLAADTLFAFDKADLTPAAEANLSQTADLVRKGATGTVQVIGHTDAKGDDAYNDALSRRRAGAVTAWLKSQPGLADRGFEPVGRGKRDPVAPNTTADGTDDPQGRARNRRVEVIIPR